MPKLKVQLQIERDEMLRWYSGGAQQVSAKAVDGRTVLFPVDLLRPFVTHHGVSGLFEIEFSAEGKFMSIQKL